MATVLSIIGALFGTRQVFGFTISQIIAWLKTPGGKAAIEVAKGVISQLKANGASDLEAGAKFLAMVAKVHKMTPEEEKIWMDRASNTGTQ